MITALTESGGCKQSCQEYGKYEESLKIKKEMKMKIYSKKTPNLWKNLLGSYVKQWRKAPRKKKLSM